MKPVHLMNRSEFGAFVFNLLKQNGVDVILSGGSCVSIYTDEAYVSGDLDFIQTGLCHRAVIEKTLLNNGFVKKNRYYQHPQSNFFVEFPGGPPSLGEAPIRSFHTLETECGELRLLTPTDCVKDRLAAYYHWKDEESLKHAVQVAGRQAVNLKDIEDWSRSEGKADLYVHFYKTLTD